MIYSLPILLLAATPLVAQTASLRGQVTDESGAVIPAARITLNGPSGFVKTGTSANDGRYAFTGLVPGSYTVQASAPELALPRPAKVSMTAGVQTLNLQLKVVSTTQRVTVQDNAGPSVTADAANNASALVLRGAD